MKAYLLAGAGLLAAASPAVGQISDFQISPISTFLGNAELNVGGRASGAVFSADQPGNFGQTGATGYAVLNPSLVRNYDSGLAFGLTSGILLYTDHLYTGRNGNDVFQYAYGHVQTGLGRIEIGMTDGAATRLANAGPRLVSDLSFGDPSLSPFRDPSTNKAFVNIFTPRDHIVSSADFAKISLYTPRLFGVQLGASFTPSESKQVLPFINSGAKVANRQQNIWEVAASYADDINDVSGISLYGALSVGHNGTKTPGHEGLTDWAIGASYNYDIAENWVVSLGGAYHGSNAYAFNLNNVLASGMTDTATFSIAAESGGWKFGGEYVTGAADGGGASPTLNLHGFQFSVGYALTSNATVSAGWQKLSYSRGIGTFYNTAPRISMNAATLHLDFHI
jgi:hypothetical protein